MRISKFDQEFAGDTPFVINVKDYDRENAPTVEVHLSKFCIKDTSGIEMGSPKQNAYFVMHRVQILRGEDPDWKLAAVEVLKDLSIVLRYYIASTCEKYAVLLDSHYSFHIELKAVPQGGSAVTETYSITLDSRKILPHPHLMILYGYQCKTALTKVRDNRSSLVPTMIGCLA